MDIRLFIDDKLPEYLAKDIIESANYFKNLCPALGAVALIEEANIDFAKIAKEGTEDQYQEVIRFNSFQDNFNHVHLMVPGENVLEYGLGGLAVANISIINPNKRDVWQPVIHEFGHTMGLV